MTEATYECVVGCGYKATDFRMLQLHQWDHRWINVPLSNEEGTPVDDNAAYILKNPEYNKIPGTGCIEGKTECSELCPHLLDYKDEKYCDWICPLGKEHTSECNDTCEHYHEPDLSARVHLGYQKCRYDENELKIRKLVDEAYKEAYIFTDEEQKIINESTRLDILVDKILEKKEMLVLEIYERKWNEMRKKECEEANKNFDWNIWNIDHPMHEQSKKVLSNVE
jgi:hypothetical protein